MNRPIETCARLHGLYVITHAPFHVPIARAALRGGARLIQLRDHNMAAKERFEIAQELRRLSREFDALFFVCDHVELAQQVGADGLHLEWSNLSLRQARQQLGEKFLLSAGVHSVERALAEQDAGADYLGAGPVFPTSTKRDAGPAIGLEGLRAISEAISIPVAAIGGLNESNIAQVPTDMASVVSALANRPNEEQIEEMTRALIENFEARR